MNIISLDNRSTVGRYRLDVRLSLEMRSLNHGFCNPSILLAFMMYEQKNFFHLGEKWFEKAGDCRRGRVYGKDLRLLEKETVLIGISELEVIKIGDLSYHISLKR